MPKLKLTESGLYLILVIVLILLGSTAVFGELMEPDAALYATIAKTIAAHDWLNLYVQDADWLDKPHLTFWLAAGSFRIFGISAFAYKLPSFLVSLLGTWYLYRFARYLYDKRTALLSAVIYLSALHVLISGFDVRAEGYLTAFSIASLYHYYRAQHAAFRHIAAGSFFAACAVMVKGIFILIPIAAALLCYWMISGQTAELKKPRWWAALILIFVFITPELYALYQQFDQHPEKPVFGEHHVSGIRFFFWEAQFGRFFNSGPIKGKGDVSFFLHTAIWAFLPWSILLYAAVFNFFKKEARKGMPDAAVLIWVSALVTFLLFSFSSFQLPHYIIVIFPQFAIITSVYLIRLTDQGMKLFLVIQNALTVLIFLLLSLVAFFFDFPGKDICIAVLLTTLIIAFRIFRERTLHTLVFRGSLTAMGLMFFLYFFFYPALLQYQSGMQAAIWLNQHRPMARRIVFADDNAFAFDFYSKTKVRSVHEEAVLASMKETKGEMIIYAPAGELDRLKKAFQVRVLKEFHHFRITKLKPAFINSKTRERVLSKYYLLKIQ